jgi:Cu(I)/Ag(I) efflux system membrane fusion protein
MKTNKIVLVISMMVMLAIAACSNQSANNKQTGKEAVVYTCPMHPEVISDKPGTCPKCGMELVIKEMPADTVHNMHGDSMKMKGNENSSSGCGMM